MNRLLVLAVLLVLTCYVSASFDEFRFVLFAHSNDELNLTSYDGGWNVLDQEYLQPMGTLVDSAIVFELNNIFLLNDTTLALVDLNTKLLTPLFDISTLGHVIVGPIAMNATSELYSQYVFYTFTYDSLDDTFQLLQRAPTPNLGEYEINLLATLPTSVEPTTMCFIQTHLNGNFLFVGTENGLYMLNLLETDFYIIPGTEIYNISMVMEYDEGLMFAAQGVEGVLLLLQKDFDYEKTYTMAKYSNLRQNVDKFYIREGRVLYSNYEGLFIYDTYSRDTLPVIPLVKAYNSLHLIVEARNGRSGLTIALIVVFSLLPLIIYLGYWIIILCVFIITRIGRCCKRGCCRFYKRRPATINYPMYNTDAVEVEISAPIPPTNNPQNDTVVPSPPPPPTVDPEIKSTKATVCMSCSEKVPLAIITPCEHECVCLECGQMLRTENKPCPQCFEPIDAVWPR